jgi:hypothetical protein
MRVSSSLLLPAFAALSLLLFGCGGQTQASTGDGGAPEGSGGATPAKGGGVCCPAPQDPCGACGGATGGWAASASDCATNGPCDGNLAITTDSHGCAVVTGGDDLPGAVCCGCPQTTGTSNPTCFEDAGVWHCPQFDAPQCPAALAGTDSNAPCDADAGSCFYCSEGAGTSCGCIAGDAGSRWSCVGSEIACQ